MLGLIIEVFRIESRRSRISRREVEEKELTSFLEIDASKGTRFVNLRGVEKRPKTPLLPRLGAKLHLQPDGEKKCWFADHI